MAIQITPFTAIAGIVVVLVIYIYRNLYPTPLPGIPYNASSTNRIFGDLLVLKSADRETSDLSTLVFAISKKLNSPIAQILSTSFATPWVIIDDPREAEDILLRRAKEFDRSELTSSFFRPILPKSTIAQFTTPELRAQKRLWADAMGQDFLKKVVAGGILDAAKELVELWTIKAEDGNPFTPAYDFECTALDAIWVAVLGSKIGVLKNEKNKVRMRRSGLSPDETEVSSTEGLSSAATIQMVMTYMNKIVRDGKHSLFPALTSIRLQLTPSYRRFMKTAYSEVQNLMRKSCERFERINTHTEDGEDLDTCAMDLVLRREILTAKRNGDTNPPDPTTDPAMLQELLLLLLGGHDSTTKTLSWFAKFAAMFPDTQTKLRDELHSALSPNGDKIVVEDLTAETLMDIDIPYLDAYVQELVRYSSTAGILTRTAVVDTVVLGCHIPKGTHLLLNTRVDPSHVPSNSQGNVSDGKNVREGLRSSSSQSAQGKRAHGGLEGESAKNLGDFNPARWLAKSESTGKEIFDGSALPSLGFGGGLRGCFGKRLAMMELRIMIVVLVLAFEFLPIEDEKMNSMAAEERIFRRPIHCDIRLKVL